MGRANKSPPPHDTTSCSEIDKKQIKKQNIGQMEVSALENSIGKEAGAGQAEEPQSALGRPEKGGFSGKNIKKVRGKNHTDIWGRALHGRRNKNMLHAFEEG